MKSDVSEIDTPIFVFMSSLVPRANYTDFTFFCLLLLVFDYIIIILYKYCSTLEAYQLKKNIIGMQNLPLTPHVVTLCMMDRKFQ